MVLSMFATFDELQLWGLNLGWGFGRDPCLMCNEPEHLADRRQDAMQLCRYFLRAFAPLGHGLSTLSDPATPGMLT